MIADKVEDCVEVLIKVVLVVPTKVVVLEVLAGVDVVDEDWTVDDDELDELVASVDVGTTGGRVST